MVQAELVGGRVKKWHLSNQERALHSIGARKVRRLGVAIGCGDWMTVMGRQRNRERSRDRLVTGDDGGLDYPLTRARTADNLFWRHHVSRPTVPLDVASL